MNILLVLGLAIDSLRKIIELISQLKTIAIQNKELTPEEEQKLDSEIEEIMSRNYWKIEP